MENHESLYEMRTALGAMSQPPYFVLKITFSLLGLPSPKENWSKKVRIGFVIHTSALI